MTDAASALAFLRTVFRGVEGDIYVCSLPNTQGARPGEQQLRSRDPKAIRAFIERWDKPGRGLFFCIGTLKADATPTKRGSYRSKANIWRLPMLPIDIDFDKHADVENPQAVAIGMLERCAVPPQITVLSGGGLHADWLLEEPLEPSSFEEAEVLLRALIKRFGSDPAVCDVSRLMRLPGSTNSKRGDARPVLIAKKQADGRTSWEELRKLIHEPPADWLPFMPRKSAGVSMAQGNAFTTYGADAWKAPVDVQGRLEAMHYQGQGDSGVHVTQLACTAAMLNAGNSLEVVTQLVLAATRHRCGHLNWDWQIEEELIRGMGTTWMEKHPPGGGVPGNGPAEPQQAEPPPRLNGGSQPAEAPPKPRLTSSFPTSTLVGDPMSERYFLVEQLIPTRDVTLFYGDGGTGKSLLTLQLAVAMQNRQNQLWLGLSTAGGRCLVFTAEEEKDELHRRFAAICKHDNIGLEELTELHCVSLAGEDATLAWAGPDRQLAPTKLFQALEGEIEALEPALVVIDTAADVFGGNENDRRQVGQFVRMLRGLAIRYDTTILLCAQPSVAGLNSGSGTSGSTAWNNSARSRLYLERVLNEDREEVNVDIRTLRNMKANYTQKGFELQLQWQEGVFVPLMAPGESGLNKLRAQEFAEHTFLTLLKAYADENREVSAKPSRLYAPALFAADARAQGLTKKRLADAMNRLFIEKKIEAISEGPPSKRRERLVVAKSREP